MASSQVVLITGASSGIGYAAALAFAGAGKHVAATARRVDRLAALETAVKNLPGARGDMLTIAADVQDANAMREAVRLTVERFGRLDVLVANAGLGQRGSFADADWSDLEVVLRTNIDGVLHSIRAAVPAMRQSGGGHIILISSVAAQIPTPYVATYSATKAFVSSLGKSLRLELADDHITITDMLVGRTATEFNDQRRGAGKRSSNTLPTMTADQVAAAVVRAADRRPSTVVLRLFDRLILWANVLAPGLIARMAKRQYK